MVAEVVAGRAAGHAGREEAVGGLQLPLPAGRAQQGLAARLARVALQLPGQKCFDLMQVSEATNLTDRALVRASSWRTAQTMRPRKTRKTAEVAARVAAFLHTTVLAILSFSAEQIRSTASKWSDTSS